MVDLMLDREDRVVEGSKRGSGGGKRRLDCIGSGKSGWDCRRWLERMGFTVVLGR